MRLRSKTATIFSKHFSPKSQRRYHQILSTHNWVSGKRSNSAPETVMVRKNNFAAPTPPSRSAPGPLQIFRWSGISWQYFYFIFST